MKKRKLGQSSLEVAPLALGTNVFGWTVDEPTAFSILDAFAGAGFNLLDTADVYSKWAPGNHGGESETVIGKWMKKTGNRDKVIVATKVGMDMGDGKIGLSKKYILQEVEESLKRLQTDYIDLYQSHKDDPNTPLEETLEAHAQLIKQGKVRVIGASNYSKQRLAEAVDISKRLNIPSYQSLQPLYNLYDRADFEKELEPFCLQNKIGVIPYYSLANGFLTGKYRSEKDVTKSTRGGRAVKYLNERGLRILKALDETAAKYYCTVAQVSLAWLMARPSVTAPISSATSVTQVNELVKAADIELDSDSIAKLTKASD